MASSPLVSVVTPTWDRDAFLLRAIMSVALQTYRPVQHVVVSDGPNPYLADLLDVIARPYQDGYELKLAFLPEHPAGSRWGHFARLHGTEIADGELIAYLDDDDELLPDHVDSLSDVLQRRPDAGFSYSRILIHEPFGDWVSGAAPPAFAQVSTSSIMHRRELLSVANWRDDGQPTIDWDIVERWLAAGVAWGFCPDITSVAHRDAPNVTSDRPRALRRKP